MLPDTVDSGGSGPPTPAQVDVEGSVLHGFLLLNVSWCIFSVFVYLFSSGFSLNFVHPFFLSSVF